MTKYISENVAAVQPKLIVQIYLCPLTSDTEILIFTRQFFIEVSTLVFIITRQIFLTYRDTKYFVKGSTEKNRKEDSILLDLAPSQTTLLPITSTPIPQREESIREGGRSGAHCGSKQSSLIFSMNALSKCLPFQNMYIKSENFLNSKHLVNFNALLSPFTLPLMLFTFFQLCNKQ